MNTVLEQPSDEIPVDTDRRINLIAISYAKNILKAGSQEQERAIKYSNYVHAYHVIVFTRKRDGYKEKVVLGNLIVYPHELSKSDWYALCFIPYW